MKAGRTPYTDNEIQSNAELLSKFKQAFGIHSSADCYRFALRFTLAFWKNKFEVEK